VKNDGVVIVTEYLVTQADRERVARRRMRPAVNHEIGEVDLGDIDLVPPLSRIRVPSGKVLQLYLRSDDACGSRTICSLTRSQFQ
jgi:uncharacterized protein YbjT (DUF2867 family)